MADILRSRVFDGLTDEERHVWLAASRPCQARRGQYVARQGEPATHFSLVESGFLKLTQVTPEGRELIVRFVGPGEPFAGVVAVRAPAYPVSAVAVEPTRLLSWSADALSTLLDRFPQVRVNIMREITMHMGEALTRVRELATERVGQRLAHTLLRLMRQCGRPVEGGVLIVHTLTRQELAEITGTTLFTVSRTLAQWESAGVIETAGRRLLIRSPRHLDALARSVEG
jgi:CRP/FNR family transcriptional regulator, nitrogen oxide reductase regulator